MTGAWHGDNRGTDINLQRLGNDDGPVYNNGQPPPISDETMQRHINDSSAPVQSGAESLRQSLGSPTTANLPGGPESPGVYSHLQRPPADGRKYSQTSILNNYQQYSDVEHELDSDAASGYYAAGGRIDDDSLPGLPLKTDNGKHKSQASFFGNRGSFVGRLKSKLGVGSNYSEMDLPLTEPGQRANQANRDSADSSSKKTPGAKFKFGVPKFGRQAPDPSTLGPRSIVLNNPPANAVHKYIDNHVSTAKYNIVTFLPKFLYEQFSKYANLFFLFTAILQQIPNISPTNRYTTIVPLGIVLLVSAGKEMVEDSRRKSQDRQLNRSPARVLRGASFEDVKWIDVQVGDILRVQSEEPFPADLVLLASSEPEGLCYIETANLDGETNLKIKQALPETSTLVSSAELARLSGRIQSEQPNSRLYTYEATLAMETGGGEKELPLNPDQLLLRGATLRNTPWIHGIVVFTGHETKLMRNATATPIKRTNVEKRVNSQILMLGAVLIVLALISTVGDIVVRVTMGKKLWFLQYTSVNIPRQFFGDIFTYWILYSNLVPISLFVTVEIIKYYQAFLISSDLDMFYIETDTPANCRTSSLVEELGQVEFVFSDKTGTLTRNMMQFRQCSIAGVQYADEVPEDRKVLSSADEAHGIYDFDALKEHGLDGGRQADTIGHFLALLSTCHTVIPEVDANNPALIKYQAASPDEGALVEGAALLGYKFVARQPKAVTIQIGDDAQEAKYELLAVCEFNSTRKRMSCIYRCPDGRIRCYCKGADTVILERLGTKDEMVEKTLLHLEEYAAEGLRTLCLASRDIDEAEFREWWEVYNTAATSVSGNRAEELDKAAELIEHDLTLLGATAIEDKLQEGVPDTIHTLQTAGIKVWVLTGDRQETAINIGMSCKLISEDMTLLIVNEENADETRNNLEKKLEAIRTHSTDSELEMGMLALVIDGKSLTYALEKDMETLFLDLAIMCKAVICCRVSPLQKALVVKLVKRHKKSILLAIGDGANDVSMIQAAHIGIGISGVEGLQAARSADVSIAQFRYLRKLLLVHGSWSYQRISKVILYFYYKNTALFITQFWYSFQNAFSGQVIYESWTLSFYNVIFTAMPPFVLGIFDQFVNARLLDRYPQLYQLSQKGVFFQMHQFWAWVSNGFYHSLVLYFASEFIWYSDAPRSNGTTAGHWVWGTALYTACLVTVLGKASLMTNMWTKYTVIAIPGSLAIWILFLPIYATVAPKLNFSTEYRNILSVLLTDPRFWLMVIVLPAFCLLRDFAWKYAKRMWYPLSYHHVQEIQKYNVQDYRPRMEQFQKAIRKVRQVQRMRKQRGYAFSQTDESQARVLQAYDTTRERGEFGEMVSSRR